MSDIEQFTEETVKDYYESVSNAINRAMKQQKITQEALVRRCERLGINIVQSTVSKIINYAIAKKGHLSLVYIAAICQVLKINMNEALPIKGKDYSVLFSKEKKYDDVIQNETLIENPDHSAFYGYVDESFDIFFFPTISSESEILHGTLSLTREDDEYCGAEVTLYIPNDHAEKNYSGRMLISLQQQACYINLVSKRLGELCSVYFFHRFFSETSLKARLAVAVTISAGDDRRPTMHRVLICNRKHGKIKINDKGIIEDEKQRHFIESQLLLNDSELRIAVEEWNALGEDSRFKELITEIKNKKLARPPEGKLYYTFEETDILKLPNYDFEKIAELIALMRINAGYARYNKIGAKSEEMLFKRLFSNDTND